MKSVRTSESARLAELFLMEIARGTVAADAMEAALAKLEAERIPDAPKYAAETVAAVERLLGVDLRSDFRDADVDAKRALAYWIIHRRDVSESELGRVIGRAPSSISKVLTKFRARLVERAELRTRVAWLNSQLDQQQNRKERAA